MNTKNSLGDLILLSLEKSVDGYLKIEDFAYNSNAYTKGYSRVITKSALANTLRRLREKGLVDFLDDQKLSIRITDEGKQRALLEKLLVKEQKWDKKYRIVIFDIPEQRRKVRDLFRSKLKLWAFSPWQKSVWVSKKNCTLELRQFIRQIGIEKWVMVIESNNVS